MTIAARSRKRPSPRRRPYITSTPGICGGKPRLSGHRITVQNIAIWHERMGQGADEIAADYDLTLAEVYAALAYYYDHRVVIDKSIRAGEAYVETMRRSIPSKVQAKLSG